MKLLFKGPVIITGGSSQLGMALARALREEGLILEDDWEKIEKLYENEWFGEQELEVFLKLAEEWRRPAALMGLLHLKKANYGFKEKKFEL